MTRPKKGTAKQAGDGATLGFEHEGDLGAQLADTFLADQHKDLKAEFIIPNPPFN